MPAANQAHQRRFNGDIIFLFVFIVLILLLATVPIIVYAVVRNDSKKTQVEVPSQGNTTTTVFDPTLLDLRNCSLYTGSICRESLRGYDSCISLTSNSTESDVYILRGIEQDKIEAFLNQLLPSLNVLRASEECKAGAISFLCLYYFGRCDEKDIKYLPSRDLCVHVVNNLCRETFVVAAASTLASVEQLPQCELLENDGLNCSNEQNISRLICRDEFYFDENEGFCLPACGVWKAFSDRTVLVVDTTMILLCCLSVIATTIIVMLACVKRKRMLKFPSILIIFSSMSTAVLDIVLLIGFSARPQLFCSSKNLLKSLSNPSTFCTFSGVLFTYILLQVLIWWVAHTATILMLVLFPMHFKHLTESGKTKYILGVVLAIGFILPSESFINEFLTGGYEDGLFILPFCASKLLKNIFYTMEVPITIVLAAGVCCMAAVLREIIKGKTGTAAEVKVILLLGYNGLFFLFIIIGFSFLFWKSDENVHGLGDHFICEALGVQSTYDVPCDKSRFQNTVYPVIFVVAIGLLVMIPVANLVYSISTDDIKTVWKRIKCIHISANHSSQANASTSNSYHLQSQTTQLSFTSAVPEATVTA